MEKLLMFALENMPVLTRGCEPQKDQKCHNPEPRSKDNIAATELINNSDHVNKKNFIHRIPKAHLSSSLPWCSRPFPKLDPPSSMVYKPCE